jgi:Uma2 family endonuclease
MEALTLELDPEEFYHPHEEDRVPGSATHGEIAVYLASAVGVHLPDRWVANDVCCYWVAGNNQKYLAPDIFVAECPRPDPLPTSFRLWEHGPLLLVVEIGSRTSLRRDVGPKLDRYAEGLQPVEYVFFDADHGDLRLHRRVAGRYVQVPPNAQGQVWSAAAGLSFGISDDGFLRAFDADGVPLPSPAEQDALRRGAEQRADEAEQRADEAVRARQEIAERLAELEAELARLRGS